MIHRLQKYFGFNELLLLGVVLVGSALVWNTVTAMQRNYRLQQRFANLESEVELLDLENQNLKYNIMYLRTDSYLELAARDKFNKAAAGETMVYLPNTNAAAKADVKADPAQQTAEKAEGGWQGNLNSWWQFLQGRETS